MMVAKLIEAAPEKTIGEAAKCMHEKSVGCLVITREGAGLEISTDRDLLFRFIRTEGAFTSCVDCRRDIVLRDLPSF